MNTYFVNNLLKYLMISLVLCSLTPISQGSENNKDDSESGIFSKKTQTQTRAKKRLAFDGTNRDDDADQGPDIISSTPFPSSVKKSKASSDSNRVLSTKSEAWQNIDNSLAQVNDDEDDCESVGTFVHDYPESLRQALTHNGLDEKGIVLAAVLNSCLYKDMGIPQDARGLNFSLLSPAKVNQFVQLGGTVSELQAAVTQMKSSRPQPVLNSNFPNNQLYSPVANVLFSRSQAVIAKKNGLFISLPATAHVIDKPELTLAECEALKQAENAKFLALELMRGKTQEHLKAEMQREYAIFDSYLAYIESRKKQLGGDDEIVEDEGEDDAKIIFEDTDTPKVEADQEDAGEPEDVEADYTGKRFTKLELERKFLEFTKGHLTHIQVAGYDIYFSPEMIDLNRIQKTGYTNGEIMKNLGGTPIGADGKPMNYHHLTHYDFLTHRTTSTIVLLSGSLHQDRSGLWHFSKKTFRLPRTRVQRKLFDPKRKFFNKAIFELLSE